MGHEPQKVMLWFKKQKALEKFKESDLFIYFFLIKEDFNCFKQGERKKARKSNTRHNERGVE